MKIIKCLGKAGIIKNEDLSNLLHDLYMHARFAAIAIVGNVELPPSNYDRACSDQARLSVYRRGP